MEDAALGSLIFILNLVLILSIFIISLKQSNNFHIIKDIKEVIGI